MKVGHREASMSPKRWQEVRRVLSEGLDLEPEARQAYIENACGEDLELRREVESLLSAYEEKALLLEQSVFQVTRLRKGTKLGIYEIDSLIGAGGMGEVYRAIDPSLGRAVAVKVLPAAFSSDLNRLRRFEMEARAAAALNHPNILAVYQLGAHEGVPYMVSELLEGQTLCERIDQGRISIPVAIDLATQIARGLAAAHEKGIVHRDLKPENIVIAKDGGLKILDFGLSKLRQQPEPGKAWTQSREITEPGAVMGTVGYMSPEQVRGEPADARSDIFAFGAVLYEMLSGMRAFSGPSPVETMNAVLKTEPSDITRLLPDVPPTLQRVMLRCLEKPAERRFQSASDLAFALESLAAASTKPVFKWPTPVIAAPPVRVTASMPPRHAVRKIVGMVAALLAVALAGVWYLDGRQAKTLTEKDTIVLGDFANSTSESVFDDALKQGLTVDLQQSPFLNILSDEKVSEQLRYMGRPAEERLTPEVAREVCRRADSKAVLDGSISRLGSHYVIAIKAMDCQGSDLLDQEQAEADRREMVLTQLHALGRHLRAKLGESLGSLQKHDTPLEQATTSSLEALQAYSMATRTFRSEGELPALPLFKHAVELDPNFAQAYADLSAVYSTLNEYLLSMECARKAYELRGKVSQYEKFSIDSTYYRTRGQLEKEAQVLEEWKQTYPHSLAPYVNLGLVDSYLGRLEKALEDDLQGLALNPDTARVYSNLADDYMSLDRLNEAGAILSEAKRSKLDASMLLENYQLAFLRNDESELSRLLDQAAKTGMEDTLLATHSDTEAFHGRLTLARGYSHRALESALRNGGKGAAAAWQADAALREAEFGNPNEAKREAAAALSLSFTKEVRIAAAMALARAGEISTAQHNISVLEKDFPDDTLLANYWLPSIRAAIALRQKQADRAISYLQLAAPYELGGATPPFSSGATLYPAYLRGEAYLTSRRWAEAASEFKKLCDHRSLVWNSALAALAWLQLGRAYVGSGDQGKAIAAYQKFLDLWHDADPNSAILRGAKLEYGRMH